MSALADNGSAHVAQVDADARVLYERYHHRIFRYCLHRLRSNEEAEDATQTAFLYAFMGLRRGVTPEFEVAWLYKIAENVCRTRLRVHRRRGQFETGGDVFQLQDLLPAAEQVRDEKVDALPEILASMPASQRRALLLREVQGLSYREIAERLETSVSAVETLLFRARRSCARELKRVGEPLPGLLTTGSLVSGLRSLLSRYLAAGTGAKAAAVAVVAVTGGALVLTTPNVVHSSGNRAQVGPDRRPASSAALPVVAGVRASETGARLRVHGRHAGHSAANKGETVGARPAPATPAAADPAAATPPPGTSAPPAAAPPPTPSEPPSPPPAATDLPELPVTTPSLPVELSSAAPLPVLPSLPPVPAPPTVGVPSLP
jgi:RNA polymerase sigma factor (sigma-70 family)